jgi:hypothetical protein
MQANTQLSTSALQRVAARGAARSAGVSWRSTHELKRFPGGVVQKCLKVTMYGDANSEIERSTRYVRIFRQVCNRRYFCRCNACFDMTLPRHPPAVVAVVAACQRQRMKPNREFTVCFMMRAP